MMETDAAELTGVGEDQRSRWLPQEQMVMFMSLIISRFDTQAAGHAEVDAEGDHAGELHKYLFTNGLGGDEFGAGEVLLEQAGGMAAEGAGMFM